MATYRLEENLSGSRVIKIGKEEEKEEGIPWGDWREEETNKKAGMGWGDFFCSKDKSTRF